MLFPVFDSLKNGRAKARAIAPDKLIIERNLQ
jgi:hypothetical protein